MYVYMSCMSVYTFMYFYLKKEEDEIPVKSI